MTNCEPMDEVVNATAERLLVHVQETDELHLNVEEFKKVQEAYSDWAKSKAEIEKIEAEKERIAAETEKIKSEAHKILNDVANQNSTAHKVFKALEYVLPVVAALVPVVTCVINTRSATRIAGASLDLEQNGGIPTSQATKTITQGACRKLIDGK